LRAVVLLPQAAYAADLMENEGITHMHAHYATHPALVAWIIQQLTGISYSITVHAHDIFVRQAMLKTKLEDATFIAAISEFNRAYLSEYAGSWVKDKIHIVHCGIVPENYTPAKRTLQAGEPIELITIGSLQAYKGQKHLVDACAHLRDLAIPFRCRLIGEGEERPALEEQIAAHQLTDQVQLLGAKTQEEVAALLATAHCYIQPSIITEAGKMEGIPVSIMEALACELPVVATELSGVPELVRDSQTGYLVPPADAMALAEAVAHVYKNYEEAKQYAANGRQLVLQEFELNHNAQQLSRLFEQTLSSLKQLDVTLPIMHFSVAGE
jgi:glycosyltransferase involved in cell wall biosynthesis